jgi:uncharacterized protein (DUF2252 family)
MSMIAHGLNFGMYAAPDRRLLFDINDFDQTLPTPFDSDVKRLGPGPYRDADM